MLQAWLVGLRQIDLREVPTPEPGPGEVVLRVEAATTCGTDLKLYRRGNHPKIPVPGPFGHEYTGTVVSVGEGVTRVKPGDAVMGANTGPCGRCTYCKRNLWNHCESLFDEMVMGTYAEYVRIPARVVQANLYSRPERVPLEAAPLVEPLASVLHGLRQLGARRGERGLVVGSGTMGILFGLLLQDLGVEVVLWGRNAQKNRWAQSLGIQDVRFPDPSPQDFDFVVECTGNPEVWHRSPSWVRPGGRVLLFGGLPQGEKVSYDAEDLHYQEKVLIGAFHFTPDEVRHAVQLIETGVFPFTRLVQRTYSLERISEAFQALDRGEGLKFLIVP